MLGKFWFAINNVNDSLLVEDVTAGLECLRNLFIAKLEQSRE